MLCPLIHFKLNTHLQVHIHKSGLLESCDYLLFFCINYRYIFYEKDLCCLLHYLISELFNGNCPKCKIYRYTLTCVGRFIIYTCITFHNL